MSITNRTEDVAKLILRVSVGSLMLLHGIAKLTNLQSLAFIKGQLESTGLSPLLAYGVYIGEIVAPILIVLGIYTRFGGFLMFVNMIFAIALVHMHELLTLTEYGGWSLELQAFYLITALVIMLLGSGKFAIKPD